MAHGRNLVYCAPTGAGKSGVADILMLRRLMNDPNRHTMLVLPFRALCGQKAEQFTTLLQGTPW